eukprot:CAMPEP_0175258952 /NCGR_PEP_ID=MMETSP0093-20121207/39488_1 /TAXON_ID=311494 /ORGANISM="Alexandrium monilatum, Strain CCMP3105" /LENGTH=96 /DNA_ID=CAMNT_0016553353 /DNA_START=44 /DNA_END=335 /DNA_ORIENTATION=+
MRLALEGVPPDLHEPEDEQVKVEEPQEQRILQNSVSDASEPLLGRADVALPSQQSCSSHHTPRGPPPQSAPAGAGGSSGGAAGARIAASLVHCAVL